MTRLRIFPWPPIPVEGADNAVKGTDSRSNGPPCLHLVAPVLNTTFALAPPPVRFDSCALQPVTRFGSCCRRSRKSAPSPTSARTPLPSHSTRASTPARLGRGARMPAAVPNRAVRLGAQRHSRFAFEPWVAPGRWPLRRPAPHVACRRAGCVALRSAVTFVAWPHATGIDWRDSGACDRHR